MSSFLSQFDVNEYISLRLEDGNTNIYIDGELFNQCKYLLLNIQIDDIRSLDEIESIDALVDKYGDRSEEIFHDMKYELSAEEEFVGHCSNMQMFAESGYNTKYLRANLAFPLLKRLSEAGDPLASKVFKKELIEKLLGGHINVIVYLISENYLKYFDSEERKIVIHDLNSILQRKIGDDSEFKRKVLALPIEDLILLSKNRILATLMTDKFIEGFNKGDEESYPELLNELYEYYFMNKNLANKILAKIPINLFRFIINTLEEEEDVLIEVEGGEVSLRHLCYHILDYIRNLPHPLLNSWVLSLLPDIKEPGLNCLKYKGLLRFLKYPDLESFLENENSILYNYMVIYKNRLIFINKIIGSDDLFWFTTYTLKKKLDLSNKGIEDINQIKYLEKISKLYHLDLSNNKIKDISPLTHLKHLEILDISGNSVNDFSVVKELANLRTLYISKSQLNDIAVIKNLRKLEICVI